jgi:hypothetical protein
MRHGSPHANERYVSLEKLLDWKLRDTSSIADSQDTTPWSRAAKTTAHVVSAYWINDTMYPDLVGGMKNITVPASSRIINNKVSPMCFAQLPFCR